MPDGILIELKPEFCKDFCRTILEMEGLSTKLDFGKILGIPGWKGARLFNSDNRFPVKALEKLRMRYFSGSDKFSIENIERNIISIGTHADKRVYNPIFPFKLFDLVYIYSHLIFDGSASFKCSYFMAPQNELLLYHKKRLQALGNVHTNFIEKEKQLYIPWVITFIVKDILEVNSFKSLEAKIPNDLKRLAMKNKKIANEIIKAAIIDEGWIEDRIGFSISNGELCRDIWEIANSHYEVGRFPIKPRERVGITNKTLLDYTWRFSSKSVKDICKNIIFPLSFKQKALEFIVQRQSRGWYKRKPNKTRKLMIKSLLESPKSTMELACELNIRSTSVSNLINGVHQKTQNTDGLSELGIVRFYKFRKNKKGERTGKSKVYKISDKCKAYKFLNN